MTLIRKDLYNDLIAVRTTLQEQLADATNNVSEKEALVKKMEDFIAAFDKTQSDLDDSIADLQSIISSSESSLDKIKGDLDKNDESLAKEQDSLTQKKTELDKEEQKLEELKKEGGTDAQIAAQQEVINKKKAEITVVQDKVTVLEKENTSLKTKEASLKATVSDSKASIEAYSTQKAQNADANEDYKEKLPDAKTSLEEAKASLTETQDKYNEFLSKNKDTISAFENQQLRRDANINKKSTTQAFNREPANAAIVKEADAVMKTVIDDELKPVDEAENDKRAEWIKAGQKVENNPDFLTADQARELSLANTWSTKEVAAKIKANCLVGEFSTTVPSLSNNVIYALQAAGYKINMTDASNDRDSEIVITWENLGAEES